MDKGISRKIRHHSAFWSIALGSDQGEIVERV